MSAGRRWALVAAAVCLLMATPFVVRAWPVPDSAWSAVEVVARVNASGDQGYTGLVRSRGGVELPDEESLESSAKLLGRDGTMRVWWAGADSWRLATLRTTGETDLVHRDGVNLRWVYESKNFTVYPDAPLRLPGSVDVLPPVLAQRVLSGVRADEVERLPTRRIAGRAAVGVRVRPAEAQSSIGRVDIWADVETGLPLRVELYGDSGPAALSTGFVDLSLGHPGDDVLELEPPDDATVRYETVVDAAAAADRYAERSAPPSLAGLRRRVTGYGPVGLYGRGATVLLALPLRDEEAEGLRRELAGRPGSACLPEGTTSSSGPLRLIVTSHLDDPWLVAGTVTPETLVVAADELAGRLARDVVGECG